MDILVFCIAVFIALVIPFILGYKIGYNTGYNESDKTIYLKQVDEYEKHYTSKIKSEKPKPKPSVKESINTLYGSKENNTYSNNTNDLILTAVATAVIVDSFSNNEPSSSTDNSSCSFD